MNQKHLELATLCQQAYSGILDSLEIGGMGPKVFVLKVPGGRSTVVGRGTSDVPGWWENAKVKHVPDQLGGMVEQGFNECWEEVAQRVIDAVGDDLITFTGHSLGGAIVQCGARSFKPDQVDEVVTFGSPATGDMVWCEVQQRYRQARYVYDMDPVPWLPGRLLGYWHPVEATWFNGEEWCEGESYWQVFLKSMHLILTPRKYLRDLIHYHDMDNYVEALTNEQSNDNCTGGGGTRA